MANLQKDVKAPVRSGEILQVVSNLLANALDALPENDTISMQLRKRGATFICSLPIADMGWSPGEVLVCVNPSSPPKETGDWARTGALEEDRRTARGQDLCAEHVLFLAGAETHSGYSSCLRSPSALYTFRN